MEITLLLAAVIIFLCIFFNRVSNKIGVPALLLFITLGMIFGEDGLLRIQFYDYEIAGEICTVALIFIMFYGGFGTKWATAKPVALRAGLLSSVGVIATSLLTGFFCHLALNMSLLEGMLIGAVLGSTDAASVFSILRSKKLNLRYNTAPLLELESGSNDPFAYMLTIIILSAMSAENSGAIGIGTILLTVLMQVGIGVISAFAIFLLTKLMFRYFKLMTPGFDTIFVFGIAVFAYAVPTLFGGNGYLSTYLVGIFLGNKNLINKKQLVNFFDCLNGLMQMLIFFLLGLLSTPSKMPQVILPAILIFLFMTFVARPISVFAILTPFRSKANQQAIVSWAGLRGAASIVFAIMAVTSGNEFSSDIFHIVFCVVLISILFQGTLLPLLSKKLKMIDEHGNVLKTFNDYSDEHEIEFIRLHIGAQSEWIGKAVRNLHLPPDSLLIMILRGKDVIIPKGDAVIKENDSIVLGARGYSDEQNIKLAEFTIDGEHRWCNKSICDIDISNNQLILMIKRNNKVIIPKGKTEIHEGDVLVMNTLT